MITERAIAAIQHAISRRRISRTVVVALFATLIQIISGSLTPALAAGTPVVTLPAGGWVIAQSTTSTLSGASVSGLGAADTYLITISLSGSTNGATLKLGTTTNLTASYGYTSGTNTFTSFTKISFTGVAADVNTALATLQYTVGTAAVSGTTPTITISAVENISGLAYNPVNNHYYKAYKYGDTGVIVGTNITDRKQSTAITWAQTKQFAGQNGYLVTITSASEDSFTSQTIPNASNIWIGARDNYSSTSPSYTFGEGYWGWASPGSPEDGAGFMRDGTSGAVTVDSNGKFVSSGSRAGLTTSYASLNTAVTSTGAGGASSNGYFNWCNGEPNNADTGNSGEHSAVTNWNSVACWNDLSENNNSAVSGFVVEWGTNSADGGFTNAVSASAKVYIAPTLTRVSGNNQIGQVNTALSSQISARFTDAMGTAILNATIVWAATRGTRVGDTSTTNASGLGTVGSWIMPSASGYDTLTASYSGAGNPSITFSARATDYPFNNGDTDTALSFNGTSQYALASNSTILPTAWNTPFTLEAWAYPTVSNSVSIVFSQGTGSNRFYIKRANGNVIWYRDGWNLSTEQNCGNFPSNAWTHLTLTFNGTSAICYINGDVTLTSAVSNNGTVSLSAPSVIGQYSASLSDVNSYWVGAIDEVKIWDSARSQANIQLDLNSRTSPTATGLLSYYDFNEGAGSILYNQDRDSMTSIAPVDFILVGNPTWNANLISSTTATAPYTTLIFRRTYITGNGGWKSPVSNRRASLLVIGGGGGGGWNSGSGGSGGGFLETITTLSSSIFEVIVGPGGRASLGTGVVNNYPDIAPTSGQSSKFGALTIAGGNPGTYNTGSGTPAGGASVSSSGAGGAGSTSGSTSGSAGGAGPSSSISGTTSNYSGGGGGGSWNTSSSGGAGGAGGGGAGGGLSSTTGVSGSANSGGGGGASSTRVSAGYGGSGVVIIRWITASKPIFTQPVNDTLTAGMVETITVSNDPISPLVRNFRWQSSSDTGTTWTDISVGSGFGAQTYSTPILETTTSGIRYQYRVIVTDSDTAGLFIVDTSTAVYLIINPRIVILGSYTVQKYGATHVDTFTTVAGTGTGNETFTFAPNNRAGITWNGSTPNQAILTIARTLGPGTYYETMTATDTKGATSQLGIAIVVSKADTITVTSLARVDTYTSSALAFLPGYTVTGLQNSDTVTSISWSYSGTENSSTSFGPSATKPINAGTYTITPAAVISNVDSYTAVAYETSTLTVNRATRTITASVSPSPLKFGATGTLSSTPSAGAGDGVITYSTSTTDSCTVSSANLQALKSTGTCSFTARISRGNNYETATSTSTNVSLTKADTLTVFVNAITPVTYTGSPANVSPTVTVSGLALTNSVGSSPVTINYVGQGNTGPTCAQGGTCVVGDTGPGGGIVFYVAPSLQSWGRYMEAAPANWSGGADNQASNISKWCEASPSIDSTKLTGLYLGTGLGYSNTYDSRLNVCTGGAIYKARAYRGGGYTNWFLPNSTELALMADVSVRSLIGLVNDSNLWGYWGSYEDASTGFIGSLVTSNWNIGATAKSEAMKNMTRPIRAFAEGGVGTTTFSSPPTDAGTYTVKASALTLSSGSLSDYQGVSYTDGTLLINRATQQPLVIAQYAAVFGTPYKVMIFGGSGLGALTQTVSAGTAAGCSLSGDTLTSTTVGTCNLTVTKAQDKNYETATAVAYVYFLTYAINQPVATPSSSSEIALSGATAVTVDNNTPPAITGLSTLTLSLSGGGNFTITGSGFTGSITVKFWRNKSVLATSGNGTTITIPVSSIQSAGASSGRIAVITAAGEAISIDSLTINP
jgi:hypothetical protein